MLAAALAAVHAAAVLLPGYLHPDEYFQGPQVAAHVLWSWQRPTSPAAPPALPWEFSAGHALRSVVPPVAVSGPPLWAVLDAGDPLLLWLAPRVGLALLALLMDLLVLRAARGVAIRSHPVIKTLATSWPCVMLLVRPLSNTLETVLFVLVLALVLAPLPRARARGVVLGTPSYMSSWTRIVALGAVFAAGIFVRPTFLLFAPPVLLYGIRQAHLSRIAVVPRLAVGLMSFAAVASVFVLFDSLFYGRYVLFGAGGDALRLDLSLATLAELPYAHGAGTPVLTPLSFLAYNSVAENLAQHGMHPRYLHALVNLPLLVGPLLYFVVRGGLTGASVPDRQAVDGRLFLLSCVVFFVGGLSLFPHQEPRFLLPAVIPLVLLGAEQIFGDGGSRRRQVLWLGFNAALLAVFGLAHQGGVVPAVVEVAKQMQSAPAQHSAAVFYHTYMPPDYIAHPLPEHAQLVDLAGAEPSEFLAVLGTLEARGTSRIFVVAPRPVIERDLAPILARRKGHLHASFAPHLSMEDLPATVWGLALDVWVVEP